MLSLKLGLIPEQLHGLTDPEVGVDAVVLRDCTQVDFVKAEAFLVLSEVDNDFRVGAHHFLFDFANRPATSPADTDVSPVHVR